MGLNGRISKLLTAQYAVFTNAVFDKNVLSFQNGTVFFSMWWPLDMSKSKTYRVSFFQLDATNNSAKTALNYLDSLVTGAVATVVQIGDYEFELRNVVLAGSVFKGEFAKYRKHGLPNIGRPQDKKDKKIALQPNEGLIEKNFFLIYKRQNLIVWQNNKPAAGINTFMEYLTHCCSAAISANDLIYTDSVRLMLANQWTLKQLDATIVKPADKSLYPSDNFSQSLLAMLASSGGYQMQISIKGEGRGVNRKPIHSKIKRALSELVSEDHAPSAKLTFEEIERPIDLVTDRVRETMEVNLPDDRYPIDTDVYNELVKARDRKKVELNSVLGAD